MGSRLEIRGLRKSFGHTLVLQDLQLTVEPGEFVSLLGPSGCGKTTTLNIVAGFFDPDHGSVRLDDRDVTYLPSYQRGVSMVFQSYALFPHMSVADNISFGLRMHGVPRAQIGPRVAEMLDLVKLPGVAERFPRQLSGGQQQRIGLARALASHPGLLLLDEPLSNLDARLRRQMQTELRQILNRVGTTTLYVTHDQEEAMTMSDRIVVMNHGRAEQTGSPPDIYGQPRTRFVAELIGEANFAGGEVTASDEETTSVRLSNGNVLQVPARGLPRPAGMTICLMTRPASLRITAGNIGPLAGQVSACAFAGDHLRLEIVIPSLGTFRCEAPSSDAARLATGTTVSLLVDDRDWTIVDDDSDPR